MTWIPVKVPKPKARVSQPRKGLQRRVRMKTHNAKRKGSSFPKQRDKKYRRWVWTENPCMLAGRLTREPMGTYDRYVGPEWLHVCWGEITPAHVGEHQARGAPDFGVIVPLCKAAHRFYDEKRPEWKHATGYSEKKMASAASGYALACVERGGVPVLSGKETA